MTALRTVSIRIKGRVQGVWFRASTKQKAEDLGILGFVSNLPDGGVYLEASGPQDAIAALIQWCKTGPELAIVQHIEVTEIEERHFSGFEIRR